MYNMNLLALVRRETVADVMADFEDKVQRLKSISTRAAEEVNANNAAIREIQAQNVALNEEAERANKCAAAIRRIIS